MSEAVSFVTELYEPNVGGQEGRFRQFAEGLAARGRAVTVYTTDYTGGDLPEREAVRGVTVERYVRLHGYVRNGSRGVGPLWKYRRTTRRLIARLEAAGEPVWVNQMPVVHLLGVRDAPGLVVDWCEYPTYWAINHLARQVARRFTHGTCISEPIAERVSALNSQSTIDVVPILVSAPPRPSPARIPGTIAYVGRVVRHKNLDALADAVRSCREDGVANVRLLIAGDGPDSPLLMRRYENSPGIEFLGMVTDSEKQRLLQSAWMVAIPGSREGLPTTAVEAAVYGTPLIASGAATNSVGEFIRKYGIGVVAPGTKAKDFLAALRSIDPDTYAGWCSRLSGLGDLWNPERNLSRLEAVLSGRSR